MAATGIFLIARRDAIGIDLMDAESPIQRHEVMNEIDTELDFSKVGTGKMDMESSDFNLEQVFELKIPYGHSNVAAYVTFSLGVTTLVPNPADSSAVLIE